MLIGKKIKLVPLEKEDLTKSLSWANDMSLNSKVLRILPVTRMEEEKWYQNIVEDPSKLVFAIKTITDSEHVGNTGLYHIDWISRRAEFWIIIGEENFHAKGVGMEVLSLMKRFAFHGLNLNRLYLHVAEDNDAAIHLYEKNQFNREGLLKEHHFVDGRYVNVLIMAALRRDFTREE